MPSAEPQVKANDQQQSTASEEQSSQHQNGQSSNGTLPSSLQSDGDQATLDPDRQLIPADRIEHAEDSVVPVDLPTVREFTQNDKINKFLLNSFLQRINESDLGQFRDSDEVDDGDQEQDFEA
ncbi:uncharacterized protein LOC129717937 isoform X1 [Wyeomyia smithii]|uniref:uncharacterized protein LOC129717937 isoform X1 n=1 Tax=Wyeomyia smithii TaxID=174621 RepID=UPI002467FC83|nr:uncharacterized protein LOC129717937 isoform X1 [Wyeomyia smithii]